MFTHNSGGGGAAINNAFEGVGTVTVSPSTFSGNTAGVGGGAVWGQVPTQSPSPPVLEP